MKNKKREIAWNSSTGLPNKDPDYNPLAGGQSPLEASAHWKSAIDQTYKDFYAKRRVSSIEMNYVSRQHIASLNTQANHQLLTKIRGTVASVNNGRLSNRNVSTVKMTPTP